MKLPVYFQTQLVEPPYFSNWADIFMPKIANRLFLPWIYRISFVTPNMVTITSFLLYLIASIMTIVTPYPLLYLAVLFLPLSYILDCVDGQLARSRKQYSMIGDYLDKTLDVLKIFVVTFSLGLALYFQSGNIIYILLGFIACFFFTYRYYIKLETILGAVGKDPAYLKTSSDLRHRLYKEREADYKKLSQTFRGRLLVLWKWNRTIFAVDEAEFVLFTAVAILFHRIDLVLWIFAVSQTMIAIWRFFERGNQVRTQSDKLLLPMRK
jgi:phosphatidylglycerophosphate synthase